MSDDDFHPVFDRRPDVAPEGARDGATRPAGPDEPQSALAGFLNDGLSGLIAAMDARGASIEDEVEDPEALRAAEDAVMHDGSGPGTGGGGKQRIDEAWSIVATQTSATDHAGLDDVARLLESDGIDFGWDPFDPRDAVGFKPPAAGLFAGKLFSIVVPSSKVGPARQSLYGQPPQGVAYPWSDTDSPLFHSDGDADASAHAASGTAGAVPPRGADPSTSDNARLAGLAGAGRTSAVRAIGVVLIILALIGFVLTMASVVFSRG